MVTNFRNILWYLVDTDDMEDLWYPTIYIGNAIRNKGLDSFGPEMSKLSNLWYYYSINGFYYTEMFTATISCNMNFKTYPLDSHRCLLDLKSWSGATYRMLLNSPKIFTFAKDGKTEIEGKNF